MNLRAYFMGLADAAARKQFAERCGSTKTYFFQLICEKKSGRRPSVELAKKIFAESNGAVGLHEMRPDTWAPPATPVATLPSAAQAT